MRFLIRATIPTEDGNKMVQDPNFLTKLEEYVNKVNAEAAYFFEANGIGTCGAVSFSHTP
jgi:hypothetical protein